MAEDTEMTYERFEDALKSLKFQSVLQWISVRKRSPLVLFSVFEERTKYQNQEGTSSEEADLLLLSEDENLTGKTPFHFALEARDVDETLFEDMASYVSHENRKNTSGNPFKHSTPFWELQDSKGRTVFETAVKLDDVAAVVKMISFGAQPEKMKPTLPEDSDSTNILGLSVACFSNSIVRHLLKGFEHCNTWDICGRRPIHIAIRFGNFEAVQTLMEKDQLEVSSNIFHTNSTVDIFRTRENFSIECFKKNFNASNSDDRSFEDESDLGSILHEVESIRSHSVSPVEAENENRSHESMNFLSQSNPSDYEEEDLFMFDDLTILNRAIEDADLIIDNEEEGEDTEYGKTPSIPEEFDSNLFHIAVNHNQCKIAKLLLNSSYVRNQIHERRADGMTPLHIAAKRNNVEIIKLLVEEGGAKIDFKNDLSGENPLHVACEHGAVDAARFFLRHGSDANSEDEEGFTPLHYACKNKKGAQCIEPLTRFGANINSLSSRGETPVYKAISRWNLDGFWKLLEYGGDPSISHADGTVVLGFLAANSLKELKRFIEFCQGRKFVQPIDFDAVVAEEGKTSLHIAVENLSVESVKALVCAGASILKCDENGMSPLSQAITMQKCSPNVHEEIMLALLSRKPEINSHSALALYPLHFASQMRFHKLMKCLLDLGLDVNMQKDFNTPLHSSAKISDVIGMKILLAGGADWKISDGNGYTPMLVCAQEHFSEGIRILTRFGATLSATNNKNENGIHLSSLKRSPNIVDTLECFAEEKGLIEMISSEGDKPIHMHVRNGRIEGIRSLLKLGCDINELSGKDETPLMISCEAGNIPAVRILLRSRADVNISNRNGHTAMYFFSRSQRVSLRILRLLLNNRGYLNHRDKDGDTLLHEAVIENHERITRLLVKRGIDVNIRNNEGKTALFIASKEGFTDIVRTLLSQRSHGYLCDPRLLNNDGLSPYQVARLEGHTEIVSLLLKAMNISLSKFAPKSLFKRSEESEEELARSFRKLQASEMCIICQEEFREGEFIRKFPCAHEFHNDCILKWIGGEEMEKSINCPICKQPLIPDRL